MQTPRGISGAAIIAVSAGAALLYSGARGKNISSVARSFLRGGSPALTPQTNPVTTTTVGTSNSVLAAADAATPGQLQRAAGHRASVVAAAQSQLGKPYVWATPVSANNPDPQSFDCSGLTMWCYAKIGVPLAHYTGTQFTQLQHVPFGEAQPGDLVFYSNGATIYHVAIYVGDGQVIEAPEAGVPVRVRMVHAGDADLVSTVGVCPGG